MSYRCLLAVVLTSYQAERIDRVLEYLFLDGLKSTVDSPEVSIANLLALNERGDAMRGYGKIHISLNRFAA